MTNLPHQKGPTAPNLFVEWEWLREFVRQAEGHNALSPRDAKFVASIRHNYVDTGYERRVSDKQKRWILDIWERVKKEPSEVWEDWLLGTEEPPACEDEE